MATHKLIGPTANTHGFPLNWQPEPFIARITGQNIVLHDEPANPYLKTYIAVEISKTQFNRFASYYQGGMTEIYENIHRWVDSAIFLVADGGDEIYCFSANKFGLVIFGKLAECEIKTRCTQAFIEFASKL